MGTPQHQNAHDAPPDEEAIQAAVTACCRVPALRHTPLRELHRLARHLRRATFAPGEPLLQQGREVSGVHVVLAGSVELRFQAPGRADPDVLGTRGPGSLLGDDFLRERRMACSAVAATPVTTLCLPPHKLPQLLDPLTLCLLSRLRPQQTAEAAAALAAEAAEGGRARAAACAELRATALVGTYGPGRCSAAAPGGEAAACISATLRRDDLRSPSPKLLPAFKTGTGVHGPCGDPARAAGHDRRRAKPRAASPGSSSGSEGRGGEARGPPLGMTEAAAARLLMMTRGAGESVRRLAEEVRRVDATRQRAAAAARRCRGVPAETAVETQQQQQQQPSQQLSLTTLHAAEAVEAAAAFPELDPSSDCHTDFYEAALVAVVDLTVDPNQVPDGSYICSGYGGGHGGGSHGGGGGWEGGERDADADALPAAIDDAVAGFVAAAHDAGLRLARWGPRRYYLLGEIPVGAARAGGGGPPGGGERDDEEEDEADEEEQQAAARAAARSAADALLAMRDRLAAVVARAPCQHFSLTVGLAAGAAFVESRAGDFVSMVAGRAPDAASKLAGLAASAARAPGGGAIVVSDAVAALLSESHDLGFLGGGLELLAARQPLAEDADSAAEQAAACRRQRAAARRRMIRRKYEALEQMIAAGGNLLERAPEYLLTQPPPKPQAAYGPPASGGGGGGGQQGPAGGGAGGGGAGGGLRGKPRLTVLVDGGGGGQPGGGTEAPSPTSPGGGAPASAQSSPGKGPPARGPRSLLGGDDARGSSAGALPARGLPTCRPMQTRQTVWQEVERMRSSAATATAPTPKGSSGGGSRGGLAAAALFSQAAETFAGGDSSCSGAADGGGRAARGSRLQSATRSGGRAAAVEGQEGAAAGGWSVPQHGRAGSRPQSRGVAGGARVTFAVPDSPAGAAQRQPSQPSASGGSPVGNGTLLGSAAKAPWEPPSPAVQLPAPQPAAAPLSPGAPAPPPALVRSLPPAPSEESPLAHHPKGRDSSGSRQQRQQPRARAAGAWRSPGGALKRCSMEVPSGPARWRNRRPKRAAAAALTQPAEAHPGSSDGDGGPPPEASSAHASRRPASDAAVAAACAGLGSVAAAAQHLATLPRRAAAVNLSTFGLYQLPGMGHLAQALSLAAGFNRLGSLEPASEAEAAGALVKAPTSGKGGGSVRASLEGTQGPAAAAAAAASGMLGVRMLTPGRVAVPRGAGALPPRLTSLSLPFNGLERLPSHLVDALPGLTRLDVSFNSLAELPPNLGGWRALRELGAAGNLLAALPPSLSALASLETLDLRSNRLRQLPAAGLEGLGRLERLHLGSNELAALPAALANSGTLPALVHLDVSSNRLEPGGADARLLTALSALTSLSLADNAGLFDERAAVAAAAGVCGTIMGPDGGWEAAPRWGAAHPPQARLMQAWLDAWMYGPDLPAAALPALRALNLSGTALAALPAWLPPGLTRLGAARNCLEELPPWACARLQKLAVLDVSGNPIARLPREVTHLASLQLLGIADCACCGGSRAGAHPDDPPAPGTGAWAAGWLAARKAGRPWPPPPARARRQVAAMLAGGGSGGAVTPASRVSSACSASPVPGSTRSAGAASAAGGASSERGGVSPAVVPAAPRRRAAIFVSVPTFD